MLRIFLLASPFAHGQRWASFRSDRFTLVGINANIQRVVSLPRPVFDGCGPCYGSAAAKDGDGGIALDIVKTSTGCKILRHFLPIGREVDGDGVGGLELHFEIEGLVFQRPPLQVDGDR